MKKIKIVFIDNAQLFRKGFSLYLDATDTIEVAENFKSVSELNDYDLGDIDLVLFDTYSDEDYYTLSTILEKWPNLRTVLLSSERRILENYLFASTNAVNGFLARDVDPEQVIDSIQKIVLENGPQVVHPKNIRDRVFGKQNQKESFFTRKELNVLGLLGKGKSTEEAAHILNNSKRTIETHRRRMIERIGCRNIIPVIMFAIENNYIKIETEPYMDYAGSG